MSAPANPGRTPPRFVPTLTTVVELPQAIDAQAPVAAPEPPSEVPLAAPTAQAPQFGAPLLADLDFNLAPRSTGGLSPVANMVAVGVSDEDALRLEEHLLHRVLQRVDLSLEARLTDTVSAAVQAQLDAMMPKLRSQIEDVLRAVVIEALAEELSETPGSAGPSGPAALG